MPKTLMITAAMVVAAGAAQARSPFFNATCPTDIAVHADEGGPIYINGHESEIHKSSGHYYEARHNRITISLSISPDGAPSVSYTRRNGNNSICQVGRHG